MMLGLKRDTRVEDESIIYPQEVGHPTPVYIAARADACRPSHTELLKNLAVINTQSARQSPESFWQRRLRMLPGLRAKRPQKKVVGQVVAALLCEAALKRVYGFQDSVGRNLSFTTS